ncbi:MarR family transcriptional regulator [Streptomyces sp. PSKA54]|uniref:MarR family transcriptional regulator n=1 Tax=Streptomyces himalayensis subsp. aureolus TaxID=2758039 RepID=A0A7W2HK60_9ACTN|nr:MarR family transcriptional regulator [Streptomyces himalayensis]MBA4866821.1 MarR family transcriptional regulator [Streptomyces himalayensis subsp. aureolus]
MTALSRQRDGDTELWWQLFRLSSYVSHVLQRKLMRRHGIGLTDFIALDVMRQAESKAMQMRELAQATGIKKATLSRVAERLERRGLAKRWTSEGDRRVTFINLTDTGRKEVDLFAATFADELRTAFRRAAGSPSMAPFLKRIRSEPWP